MALRSVVWTGARFIANGADYINGVSVILDSPDGLTWHRQALDLGGSTLGQLEVGPRGIVVLGGHEDRLASSWVSDDGLTWSKRADAFGGSDPDGKTVVIVSDIVATAHGWLAVGTERPACIDDGCPPPIGATVWTSDDGLAWTRVVDQVSLRGGVMNSVALGGPGYVAVGWAGNHAAVWSSPDGQAWSRIPDEAQFQPPIDAGPAFSAMMTSVVAFGGEMVALGAIGEAYGEIALAAWWSRNGTDWSLVVDDWSVGRGVRIMSAGPDRTLAIGDGEDGCLGGVTSLGGSLREFLTTYHWAASPCSTSDTGQFHLSAFGFAASPDILVAVGEPDTDGDPVVWVYSIP